MCPFLCVFMSVSMSFSVFVSASLCTCSGVNLRFYIREDHGNLREDKRGRGRDEERDPFQCRFIYRVFIAW